jgi:hypothetical protein
MEPDIAELRKNYERLDDARIIRLASEEASELRPEALELLKQIIKERKLSPVVSNAINVQVKEIDEKTLSAYCDLLRRLPCPVCNSINEKLNANIIASLASGYYFSEVQIACPSCLDKAYGKANLNAALFGWWRILGIINMPRVFAFNRRIKKLNHIPEASNALKEFVLKRAGRIELYRNNSEELTDIILYPR